MNINNNAPLIQTLYSNTLTIILVDFDTIGLRHYTNQFSICDLNCFFAENRRLNS